MPTVGGDRGGTTVGTPDNVFGQALGRYQPMQTCIFAIDASMTPVANNTLAPWTVYTPADPTGTHVYDPLACRVVGSSYVSTYVGATWPSGSYFLLGPGWYMGRVQVVWDSNTTGTRQAKWTPIDNRVDTPELDHVYWNPAYNETIEEQDNQVSATSLPQTGFQAFMQRTTFTFRVLPSLAPAYYGAFLFQDSGAPRTLSSGTILLAKLSNFSAV